MTISLVTCSAIVAVLSACRADRVDRREPSIPVGRLGHPIGTFLRIEGTRLESGKVGEQTLLVDRVDGEDLASPIGIWIENAVLPANSRCRVSGYESGRWIGVPPEVQRAEDLFEQQAAWQFQLFFMVTSADAPDSLAEQFRKPGSAR